MYLHANAMNILNSRFLAATASPAAGNSRPGSIELHALHGSGSMTQQWDGDVRRHRGQAAPRAMRALLGGAVTPGEESGEQRMPYWD